MANSRRTILSQVLPHDDDAADRKIKREAIKRLKSDRRFSRSVKGISCSLCGSRKTKTEFYRIQKSGPAKFGVTACDDCGAC